MKIKSVLSTVLMTSLLAGCNSTMPIKLGDEGAKTTATGSAGGATATGENKQLEKCDKSLGTLALQEDVNQPWYYQLTHDYRLPSTTKILRLLIQQSNCFVVVERGKAMANMQMERALMESGEARGNSNMGKGQMVAADYTMEPSITFNNNDAGGVKAGLASFGGVLGAVAGVAGSLKFKEASTMLTMIDNRSGVQLAIAEGSASKTDFSLFGGLFGGSGAAGLGGYTNTAEGKVIAGAFTDAYNNIVKAVKNYKAQTVEGGLGAGGTLGVSGGSTPASQKVDQANTKKKK